MHNFRLLLLWCCFVKEKAASLSFFASSHKSSIEGQHFEKQKRFDETNKEPFLIAEQCGPFTPQLFASSQCWTLKPFIVRNAFGADQKDYWPTVQDLQELAANEDSEVRIITQNEPGNDESYELNVGPFGDEYLDRLFDQFRDSVEATRAKKSVLVINDVDRFLPALSDWMASKFSFIPTWRRDDGQMSYSNIGAGIGRHVDNYDVFLIQTSGAKEWRIGKCLTTHQEEDERLIPNIDVRILRQGPNALLEETVIVLHPGDLLYLPPRVSHKGTALTNDCGTLSVGCRAPSAADMVTELAEFICMKRAGASMRRYTDPDVIQKLLTVENSNGKGQITMEAKAHARQLVVDALNDILLDDDAWDKWFGSYVSQSKRIRNMYPIPLSDSVDNEWIQSLGLWGDPKLAVQSVINGKGCLYQAEGIIFAYSRDTPGKTRLFVNGELYETENTVPIEVIANERRISIDNFPDRKICSSLQELLEDLLVKGLLYGADE